MNVEFKIENLEYLLGSSPNPVNDVLQIHKRKDIEDLEVAIYNSVGVLVSTIKTIDSSGQINFGKHPAGVYFLNFLYKDRKEVEVIKVVKIGIH